MRRDENQNVEYKESWHDKYLEWICGYANAKGGTLYIGNLRDVGSSRRNPLVADIFSRLEFAERRGSGIGKMLDAYSLPLANLRDQKPTFVSDTSFRVILPNLTYGLTKVELVTFAERQSTPNSRTPNSRTPNSRPDKSTRQVDPTSHTNRQVRIATSENRARLIASLLIDEPLSRREIMALVGLRNRESFYELYVLPSFEMGYIEYTIPNKPNSRLQKYRLTDKGRAFVEESQR